MLQWRITMEQINYKLLKSLDEKYGSPFYIMDPDKYKQNISNFINASIEPFQTAWFSGYIF